MKIFTLSTGVVTTAILLNTLLIVTSVQAAADHDHKPGHEEVRASHDEHADSTRIDSRAARAANITVELAAPAKIHDTLELFARVELLPQNRYRVAARYAGIVQGINASVGDRVNVGDVVATIENSDTLQNYVVKAPASGIVLRRFVNRGDAVSNKPLLLIVDVSSVAIDMSVFASDRARLVEGQTVIVRELRGKKTATARIDQIAAIADNNVTHVHASLPNAGNQWRVGDAVRATVQIAGFDVAVAVRTAAIQDFDGSEAVFVQSGEHYQARILKTGRRDAEFVEVLAGIAVGEVYVSGNSYLVKADIQKSAASHEH